MLIGGHVSPAGGLVNAFHRGVERNCDAIQIFNQSPRAWRPTNYRDEDVAEFRELLAKGPVTSIVIHAVYLINPASKDPTIREKSLGSLAHALRAGDAIGAHGVVVHPGSQVGEPLEPSLRRVGDAIRHVLAESERCPLLLENTAGAGGTIGRSFEELAQLIELGGGHERIGLCLDSCHMLASGFDVRTAEGLSEAIDGCAEIVGLDRLRCLHVNDSQTAAGLQPRPARAARRRRAGPRGLRGLLLGAALRGPAGDLRGPRPRRQRGGTGGHPRRPGAARGGPGGAEGEAGAAPQARLSTDPGEGRRAEMDRRTEPELVS